MAHRSSDDRHRLLPSRAAALPRRVVAVLLAAAAALTLHAQDTGLDRLQRAAGRTAERLKALQQEADALASQQRTLLGELRKLEIERQISLERLDQLARDRQETERRLKEAEARADALAQQAQAERPEVEARLVQLYKLGRAGYWRLLLNVDDLRALGRAYRTASMLTALDRARVAQHFATLDALARERQALQARSDELAALQAEAARARTALDKAVASRTALVDAIDARRDLNAQLAGELQTAQTRLQSALSDLQARGGASAAALPLRPLQGELPWPVSGRVTRRFGRQPDGQPGSAVVRNGVDIAAAEGQPVRPVHAGTVAFADRFEGYGNLVIVEHAGGDYSLYGYLKGIEVARGQKVEPGDTVGSVGVDPAGNPSLYFELRVDGAAVDPVQWLEKARLSRPSTEAP